MPVRMDAPEGYRPLRLAVKASANSGPNPPANAGDQPQKGRQRLTGWLRTIRSGACEPRPTTLRVSGTRRPGQHPGRGRSRATAALDATVPRSRLAARPPRLIAPDHPATGRAWPSPRLAKDRCAATRPRPVSRRRFTRRASSPPGTSVVTAATATQVSGPARRAMPDRPTRLTTPGRPLPQPGRPRIQPARSPDGPILGRVPVRAGGDILSRPGARSQVVPACPGITPGTPTLVRNPVIRCSPSVIRLPT